MSISIARLANALRLLAFLWLMAWPLFFVTLWGDGYSSFAGNIKTGLGTLLIPSALAFAVAWALDRMPTTHSRRDARRPEMVDE